MMATTRTTCLVEIFDVGTGEAKALEYSFVDGCCFGSRPEKESLKEALREGGTRLDAFEKWFDSAVSHTCELMETGRPWGRHGTGHWWGRSKRIEGRAGGYFEASCSPRAAF